MKKKVAIILINYSGTDDTLECLDSIDKVGTKHDVSVYVGHYKPNKGLKKLQVHKLKPKVIPSGENLGFAGFNNLGMRQAIKDDAQMLVILNNDTIVEKNFLDPLVAEASKKQVGLVSPLIYFAPGYEFHKDSYTKKERGKVVWYAGGVIDWNNVLAFHKNIDEVDRGHLEEKGETDFTTGCCVTLSKSTLEKIGYMPEKYFMYMEDVAWNVLAKKKGYKNVFVPDSVIWHKNAQSSEGSGSEMHVYYQTRNRILFAKEFASRNAKLAIIREGFKNWRHGEGDMLRRGSKDGILGKTGKLIS